MCWRNADAESLTIAGAGEEHSGSPSPTSDESLRQSPSAEGRHAAESATNAQTAEEKALVSPLSPFLYSQAALGAVESSRLNSNFEAILFVMKEQASSACVQLEGCTALRHVMETLTDDSANIVRAKSTDSQEWYDADTVYIQMAEAGAVTIILQAVKEHADSVDVLAAVCQLLLTLSRSETVQSHISDASGVSAVLRAMDHHPDEPVLQEYACGVLRNLANNEAMQ
eukprot:1042296-Rhodomonas_salina.1